MFRPTRALWMLLLPLVVTLAGCSARPGASETAAASPAPDLLLDLPAITLRYDQDGIVSLGNVPLSQLGTLVPPGLVSQLTLTKEAVAGLVDANVQHVQITNTPTGLGILVNGQPLPAPRWDATSLANALDLAKAAGATLPAELQNVLPKLPDIGVGVTVQFPLAQGALPIPLPGATTEAAATRAAMLEKFRADSGGGIAVRIPVVYDADGDYSVEGVTDAQWQLLTGFPFGALRLSPGVIQGFRAAEITGAQVRTDVDGIHLAVNGKELPALGWELDGLPTLLQVGSQAGLLDLPEGLTPDLVAQVIAAVGPALESSNVEINVTFPQ
jgi:hypothetical protein